MPLPDPEIRPSLSDWRHDVVLPAVHATEIRILAVDLRARDHADTDLSAYREWAILCGEERARAARFIRPRDGRRFLLCRGALRIILAQLLATAPEHVVFRGGLGGKPELDPGGPGAADRSLRFNVSHSDELALIAVSRGRELGVDVERLRPIGEAARIVESYFTTREQSEFRELPEEDRAAAFLRAWTRKEAILKAKGVGLAGLASGYETRFGTATLPEQFTPAVPIPRVHEWWLWEASPRDGYVAALAAADAG
jgi:4'-phosphopantetheinyl transferase